MMYYVLFMIDVLASAQGVADSEADRASLWRASMDLFYVLSGSSLAGTAQFADRCVH